MTHILLIEDDENLAVGLEYNLRDEGYEVTACRDGESGLKAYHENKQDLVVLDWMLPGIDGMAVLSDIRKESLSVPVLILSARNEKDYVIEGLDHGANDYLTKPFDLHILMARIRTLLRNRAWLSSDGSGKIKKAQFGDCSIDFETFDAEVRGKKVTLSFKGSMIMKLLWEKKEEVVSREEILQKVWGIEQYIQSRTVDNFIVQLRRIFEVDPKNPKIIQSVHGQGYRFSPPKNSL